MRISDIFKKKTKARGEPKMVKKAVKKGVSEVKVERLKPLVKIPETAYKILKTPHVAEKAADLVKKNQYVFKVYPRANKIEIKRAIEELYDGVKVLAVKIINIPPKRRRLGKVKGWRSGYKKAIVRIKEGQKIEVLPR